jgi:hypothetical protein
MQYHFVVMYDEDTDKFVFDSGTTEVMFDDRLVFDSNTNEWHEVDELMEADYADYATMLVEKLDGVY